MKTSLFLGSVWISSTSEAFLFTRNQRNQHPGFLSSHLSKPLESVPKEIAIEGPIEFDRGVEDHSFARVPAVLPETHVWVDAYYSVNDEDAAHFLADEVLEKCKEEEGTLYVSWHEKDGKMLLKGGFKDGAAVNAHYSDAGWLRENLRKGPANLELLELYGNKDQLEITQKSTDKLQGVKVLEFENSGKYHLKLE